MGRTAENTGQAGKEAEKDGTVLQGQAKPAASELEVFKDLKESGQTKAKWWQLCGFFERSAWCHESILH